MPFLHFRNTVSVSGLFPIIRKILIFTTYLGLWFRDHEGENGTLKLREFPGGQRVRML